MPNAERTLLALVASSLGHGYRQTANEVAKEVSSIYQSTGHQLDAASQRHLIQDLDGLRDGPESFGGQDAPLVPLDRVQPNSLSSEAGLGLRPADSSVARGTLAFLVHLLRFPPAPLAGR